MFLNKDTIYFISYHRKNDGKNQPQLSELMVNLLLNKAWNYYVTSTSMQS